MDAKRFEQIENLYHAALTCQSEERSAVLDRADPEVRREVELMLAQQGSALDRPAWEGVANSTVNEAVPRRLLERYEIEGNNTLRRDMSPEHLQEIDRLALAARQCEPSQRDSYLAEACGGDRGLQSEVESILRGGHLGAPEPGTMLGPYRIEAALGAGGMGEVFRGRDTRLNRAVAVKVLRAQFDDRFAREARAIAALNHPHICTLYDVGPNFLVMELIQGETLASRLSKGPLPLDDVLQFGAQIASAVAAAHAKGIVHRDLKPGNIMLTKTGAKVLDFGLAKAAGDETITMTQAILGTPAYMSPEQRAGSPCDQRSDIYALGLILREMACGKRGTASCGAETPNFKQLADRCLRDDPEDRWQSAGDLAAVLEWARIQPTAAASPPASSRWPWLVAACAVLLLLALVAWNRFAPRPAGPSVVRLALEVPAEGLVSDPGQLSGPPAISPDGKVVVLALSTNGRSALWMRRLDSDRFERLDGTDGSASQPFWSPDGTRIGFFAGGKLKKMHVPHGVPEVLCDHCAEGSRGGAWSSQGVILFGVNYRGLMKVSENGGEPVPVVAVNEKLGENSLRFPHFLPDGNRFIYFSRTLDAASNAVYLDALDTIGKTPRKRLTAADGPSALGHDPLSARDFLVFPKDGQLWAQPLREATGALFGEKLAISEDAGQFSLSSTGTLVFRRATSEQHTLVWVDRAGKTAGSVGKAGDYWDVALSPNERYAAVVNHRAREGNFWVELIDLAQNLQSPFSDPSGRVAGLAWSHDSANLYFTSWSEKGSQLLKRAVDSASAPQLVLASQERYDVMSFTPDGKTVAADHWVGQSRGGVGLLFDGQAPWKRLESAPSESSHCQFSPDGKWLLYQSRENGAQEVYVSDFPGFSIRRRLSVAGGIEARWSRDGREIFYIAKGFLVSLAVTDPARLALAQPATLFRMPGGPGLGFSYDVTHGSLRFLVRNSSPPVDVDARHLSVIFNWPQLLGEERR